MQNCSSALLLGTVLRVRMWFPKRSLSPSKGWLLALLLGEKTAACHPSCLSLLLGLCDLKGLVPSSLPAAEEHGDARGV